MGNTPNSTTELLGWVVKNVGVTLKRSVVTMAKTEDNTVVRSREDITYGKIAEWKVNGFYFKFDDINAWIGLDGLERNMLFTEGYFAILVFQDDKITVKTYSYTDILKERQTVRFVLNCSVGDINHDMAVKRLSKEEILYCLEHETRKTGITKLKRQLKKLTQE